MKNFFPVYFAAVLMFASSVFAVQSADAVPGELIIKFRQTPGGSMKDRLAASAGFIHSLEPIARSQGKASRSADFASFYLAKYSVNKSPFEAAAEVSRQPEIEYAQPNFIYRLQAIPNDPNFPNQAFWRQINAPQAWDITHGSPSILIAILDTGVDYLHQDLQDNIWRNPNEVEDGIDNDANGYIDDLYGWDFVTSGVNAAAGEDVSFEDNDPMDRHGHGTHVAGLASAVTNNGIGVAGAGWSCRILPLRIGYKTTDGGGSISTSSALKAIEYAVDNGASIINMSFGAIGNDYALRDWMRFAFENGLVIVKAAGNNNSNIGYYPDVENWVLSTAAVDAGDRKTSYSNYGSWVKVSAPGDVFSTLPGNRYGILSGTSMAAPIVAGVAGLVRAVHPDWSPAQVLMHVVDTADDIDSVNPRYAGLLGRHGRVNAYRAVSEPFASKPDLAITRISVEDMGTGNDDQRLNVGETVDLLIRLTNNWAAAHNVELLLTTEDPSVSIITGRIFFSQLPSFADRPNFVETTQPFFRIKLSEDSFPHNIPFVLTARSGDYEQTMSFTLAVEAKLLVVDDDGNSEKVEKYYQALLDSLGMPYDRWDREVQGRVAARLRNYDFVMWICANALPTLNGEDREDLISFLREKRTLFISGENIAWDLSALQTAEDAQQRGYYNQYRQNGFDAKSFYETHLHAQYLEDATSWRQIKGLDTSPISRGLSFYVSSPPEEWREYSPDVVEPIRGGQAIFAYPDNRGGAVSYTQLNHKIIHFAFGGLENVLSDSVRQLLMRRIIADFTGLEVSVEPLQNIESYYQDMYIGAIVKGSRKPSRVYLFWRKINENVFSRLEMTAVSDTTFFVDLPRQPNGTIIEYGVQAVSEDGFYSPIKLLRANLTAQPPTVAAANPKASSLALHPIVAMTAADASGVDESTARVYFWTRSTLPDSAVPVLGNNNLFTTRLRGNFSFGDTLYYQFSICDLSPYRLRGKSPVYKLLLGFEGFEGGLDDWETGAGDWNLETVRMRSGRYGAHNRTENGFNYPANADLSLTLKYGLDLSRLSQATLSVWMFYGFSDQDYGLVEASRDFGRTWIPLAPPITGAAAKYYKAEFDLNNFTGPGHEEVLIRFRLISNDAGTGPGWFIDDIELLPIRTHIAVNKTELPFDARLVQAYPNPFNSAVSILYELPQETHIRLTILDALGRETMVLAEGNKPAGRYKAVWNGLTKEGHEAASGIYLCRLETNDRFWVHKILLLR
ncbi:MAG: S8 family serine peptidase [candidate division KSB1 bacterium]|nr:S8 family serine peptidase [candidate division KSB1 bacterium]